MKPIAIYGAGGLGREVLTIIEAINKQKSTWKFIGFFDDGVKGHNILGGLDELNEFKCPLFLVIALGSTALKENLVQKIANDNIQYATLIHPRATISSKSVVIGEGTIIGAGAVLTVDIEVGKHVLINLNATIGHDCKLGDYCSVMPGVNIAGAVVVGAKVLVGSGANILNGLKVGENAKIGSGAVVTKDIIDNNTVIGIPARPCDMISEFKPAIIFLVKFIALYLILNLLYGLFIDSYTPQPDPVTRIVTRHVTAILSLFESDVEVVDNSNNPSVFIHNDNRNVLSVYEGCNSVNVAIVFCVFLLSYGRPIKRTLWFVPLGLIIIYLTNLLRIALLYWVAEEMPKLMYFTHKYLFTAFIYVVVFALWYWWVTKLYKIKNEDAEE